MPIMLILAAMLNTNCASATVPSSTMIRTEDCAIVTSADRMLAITSGNNSEPFREKESYNKSHGQSYGQLMHPITSDICLTKVSPQQKWVRNRSKEYHAVDIQGCRDI